MTLLPRVRRTARLVGLTGALLGLLLTSSPAPAAATVPIGSPSGDFSAPMVAWGDNTYGQGSVPAPLRDAMVRAVAAGANHNLVLTADRRVVAWGDDRAGQASVPSSLRDTDVAAIAAGGDHSLVLTAAGRVVAWGDDQWGQSSVPPSLAASTVTAIAAGPRHSLALTSTGRVVAWGDNREGQALVPASLAGRTVTGIAAGATHSLAVLADGTITGWGDDAVGELHPPPLLAGQTIVSIAAGGGVSVAVTDNGTVESWGDPADGAVPAPAGLSGVAVAAVDHTVVLVGFSGKVTAWGHDHPAETPPAGLDRRGVVAAAAGARHVLVMAEPVTRIFSGPDPSIRVGDHYFINLLATGVPQPDFRVTSGALPPGLTLTTSGQLSGRPTRAGSFTFAVTADNHVDPSDTQSFTMVVTPGAAVHLVATSGAGQTAQPGETFPHPLVATATDAYGDPIAGVAVTFTLPSTDPAGGVTFEGGRTTETVSTAADGTATSTALVAGHSPGPVTASALFDAADVPVTWDLIVAPAVAVADLGTKIRGAPARVKRHQRTRVAFVVVNAGPDRAADVRARFTVPTGWRILDADGGTRSSAHTVSFDAESLGSGDRIAHHLVLRSSRHRGTDTLVSRVSASSSDPDRADNTDRARVRVR